MSRKACLICEKPSQSRNWAKALGGMSGTYKGQSYIIVPARGHLYGLAAPDKQVSDDKVGKYKQWDLANLPWNEKDFSWKRVKGKDTSSAIAGIKSASQGCDEIIFGGDLNPSGEGGLIILEIVDELGLVKPGVSFSRAYFSDEAVPSLQKAFENRKSIPNVYTHDECVMATFRTKWDYMSQQWSRVGTLLGDGHSVLRAGRLKSAMVLLCGQQLDAVKNYVKKPYFQNRFRDENGVVYTNPDEPTFDESKDVPENYSASDVVCDSKTMKKTSPPKLIDLATLSARLAPKGIKSNVTLAIYQKMYENQVVSYPRTEDKCITEEQFKELLPKVDAIAKVVGVDVSNLTHRTPRKTHIKAGMAHGANRPGVNVPKSLAELDKTYGKGAAMIYEILAKSYLAMLCEDYEYEQQKGHVKDYPAFVGSVNVPKKQGWKAVYDSDDSDDDDNEGTSGLGSKAEPFVYEGANKKPQIPTMKWLMKQLERLGIGTGATRTSCYGEVTNSKAKYPLLKDTKGRISFAECGEMSYLLLPNTHIGDLQLTKRVEEQMKGIAEGKLNADDCLHEVQQLVIDDIAVMKANAITMRERLGVTLSGPESVEYAEGTWNGKNVKFKRTWSGHRFTDEEVADLLAGNEITLLNLVSAKSGAKFGAKGKLEIQDFKGRKFVGFKASEMLSADGKAIESGDYAEGTWRRKKVKFKRTWGGHRFTDEEVADLLAGKEIDVLGLKSKTGKTYGVRGKLAIQNYQGRKFVGFTSVGFIGEDGKVQASSGKSSSSDYAEGEWNGRHVKFKRVWGGHKFTDAEVKKLLDGKTITLKNLKNKAGKTYSVKGKLGEQEYNGKTYVGFVNEGFVN